MAQTTQTASASKAHCAMCGSKAVRPRCRPGRLVRYRNLFLPVPDSFAIPTCGRCHGEFPDARSTAQLAPLLHDAYRDALRWRVGQAIGCLMQHISQRKLELLLGLSQGYLSRLRAGKGAPSPELVSHLALIAHDPKARLLELERYWADPAGLPVQTDE